MAFLTLAYVLGIVLHLMFFAAWFGMSLPLARRARTALAAVPEAGVLMLEDGAKTIRNLNGSIVLAYVFALLTFASRVIPDGGMAVLNWPYHTAVTLGLILVLIQLFVIRPSWNKMQTTLGSPEADAAHKRLAIGTGVGHLLWVILVVLMFWNRLAAAATA